jgi:lysophospholipase
MDFPARSRRAHPEGARFTWWSAPDGWRHRLMEWPRAQGAPARGTLLFAGGRGDFIEKYLEAYGHWHDQGWDVIAFDWRGQGKSAGNIEGGNHSSFDPLVADIAALIAWARERSEGEAVVGVAHSMGGHLLLRALVDGRASPDAAVLVAPMIEVNSAPLPRWAGPVVASLACRLGFSRRSLWKPASRPREAGSPRQRALTSCVERYLDEAWWWDREPGFNLGAPSWAWLRAAFRSARAFTPGALAKVDAPILLLGTARDRLVSPSAIVRTAASLRRSAVHIYPDAGHEILREADAVRLDALARIDTFLAEHAR